MNKFLIALMSIMLIVSCSEVSQEKQQNQPVMVKLDHVKLVNENANFTFPAEVGAVKTVDVSFEVSGRLVQQDIVTGQQVSEGHLLATIDQKPFIRQVKEQTSKKQQAERELTRIKSMLEKGLVSQRAFDNAQTTFELAEIELSNSQQQLSYTQLLAPFDAQISERLVDNNSFVQAGQTIARIQDMSKIYFTINVPERVITANTGKKIKQAKATIGSLKQSFPVTYLEHSTTPDPVTQTYRAVFAMDPIAGVSLIPGARAMLEVVIEQGTNQQVHVVPLSAVLGDKKTGFYTWRFIEGSQSVEKAPVKVLRFLENVVVIESDLTPTDQIVTAGASKMYSGMVVQPYQAEFD